MSKSPPQIEEEKEEKKEAPPLKSKSFAQIGIAPWL